MGEEYGPAIDMWMPNWLFYGALSGLPGTELSIVLHKTACNGFCSATDVANYFISGSGGAHKSVHFIVGKDGSVIQCVHLVDGAGGNCCLEDGHDPYWDYFVNKYGNINDCTYSIEHEDWTNDNSDPMPQAQVDASHKLVLFLVQTKHIPLDHIKTHQSLDPISRARCPGPTYDMAGLISYLEANLSTLPTFDQIWNSIIVARKPTGIYNALNSLYTTGGAAAILGAPTSQEEALPSGHVFQNFQTGYVYWDGSIHLFKYA